MIPPSSRGSAIIALFSMYSCSWWPTRYVPSITTSAAASAASTSPAAELVVGEHGVRERAGRRRAAAARCAAGHVRARLAQRVPVRRRERGRRGSAWCRISPPTGTRIGWSVAMLATTLRPGMSSAVTTTTRSQAKSGSRSMPERAARGRRSTGSSRRTRRPGTRGRRCRGRCRSASPGPRAGPAAPRATPRTAVAVGPEAPRGRLDRQRGRLRRSPPRVRPGTAGCQGERPGPGSVPAVRPGPGAARGPAWRRCARRRRRPARR